MRKHWLGDSRDYVKWSCVYRTAGETHFVLYVPMLRPDSFGGDNLEPAVRTFFEEFKDLNTFERLFHGRFEVIEGEYTKADSDEYFSRVKSRLAKLQENSPVLIFVDPDTGLAPRRSKDEHLQIKHYEELTSSLKSGDRLVLYQHASRETNWRESQRKRLIALHDANLHEVSQPYHEEKVAKDVCFFTITRY